MANYNIDKDFLEFALSLIDDEVEKSILEIIYTSENDEIMLEEMIKLVEEAEYDQD